MRRPLEFSEPLDEFIRHLAPEMKKKIRASLDEISLNPARGKQLMEELKGFRSYKVGLLRVIYREREKAVEIVTIGPRRTIYQKAALEIQKKLHPHTRK